MHTQSPLMRADVCLILEGTYPYVPGGVSTWTHELIEMHKDLRFVIVALLAADAKPELRFTLPDNVVGVKNVYLQQLPKGEKEIPPKERAALFAALRTALMRFHEGKAQLTDLTDIIHALKPHRSRLGSELLLNCDEAWQIMRSMYDATMPDNSFIDYFWSWRVLFGGLYSILLFDLPEADVYHALCTGYGGMVLARAQVETGKPCLVTEHGIYTNERRIEIASADWLEDEKAQDLCVSGKAGPSLKDFWIDTFRNYSRLCYDASDRIITLYEGNQLFQRQDGAEASKLAVIPNGIDFERYAAIGRAENHPPTVALIGRVVPIKDIKTYIKAASLLCADVPGLKALIIGPTDEDPLYFRECEELVKHFNLEETVIFTGKVRIEDYLPHIDVMVLTSISEAQPLVILEAGAAGIPTVATNVGACSEMIYGHSAEAPALGAAGCISALANPQSTADCMRRLLNDPVFYSQCSQAIRARVEKYYNKRQQHHAYASLYKERLPALQQRSAA